MPPLRITGLLAAPFLALCLSWTPPAAASAQTVSDPARGAATAALPLSRALEVVLPGMGCRRSRTPPPVPASAAETAWKGRICDRATDFPETLQLVVAGPHGSQADVLDRVQLRWADAQGGVEPGKGRDAAERKARRMLALFGVADPDPVVAAFLASPPAFGRFPPDRASFDTPELRIRVEVFGYERVDDDADHRLTVSRRDRLRWPVAGASRAP